jgi:hypothetical protein
MKNILVIIASVALLASGCDSSNNLYDSIYIFDEVYKDLPAYTEWGYNTFGAYYDRDVFISGSRTPAKILVKNNKTVLSLAGHVTGDYYYDPDMTLKFVFAGYSPSKYADLINLNDSTIDLTNPKIKVCIVAGGAEDTLDVLNGELFFKRVQHLYVDKKSTEAILSGYFHLQIMKDGTPETISNGRFDLGIGNENFYAL